MHFAERIPEMEFACHSAEALEMSTAARPDIRNFKKDGFIFKGPGGEEVGSRRVFLLCLISLSC